MGKIFINKMFIRPYLLILLCILGAFCLYNAKTNWLNSKDIPNCKRCNIVLIVIDPLRADELPCYGYSTNTAPNICKFAQKSILYANTFSQSSWTLPSIMSLFSSQYPTHHNVFIPDVDVLPAPMTTLPMALKAAGYKTIFIGPVNDNTHHVPLDKGIGRGFDTILPYTTMSEASTLLRKELTTSTTGKPLFVFIHSFDLRNDSIKAAPTLFPLDPTYTYGFVDPYLRSIELKDQESKGNITSYRRIYDERLRQLDSQFPSILQSISSTNMDQNTIVAITSDHGDEFGEHGLSSHGVNLFKTVTHIPFILSAPNLTPQKSFDLVSNIDIYPTLLHAVGIQPPSSINGINVLPNTSTKNAYVISQLEPEKKIVAIRNLFWSYYFNPDPKTKYHGTLYNNLNDPNETHPLQPNKQVIDELISAYESILSE